MKLKTILFFYLILLFQSCSESELTPDQLANKVVETYEKHSSMSYDIDYRIKYFSNVDDTTKVSAQIDLIRMPEDSIFGGHIWIEADSFVRYYDSNFLYLIDHRTETITKYLKEKPYTITGNTVSETIRMYFLDPQRLIRGLADSTSIIELETDHVNNKEVWQWKMLIADNEYTENTWKNIWIDKTDYSIPKMNFSSDMQGENQYNQWELSNISFDKTTAKDLANRFANLSETYSISDYKERSKEDTEPLANGSTVPNLEAVLYDANTAVKLEDYKGEMLLIDFWYLDCFPCIKAIPHLNDIHNRYKGKGLKVLGVNPFNNNEKDLKRFPNFLEKNRIDYPIVFIEREDTKLFKIYAYPTFYLIDRKGKVVHSQVGFNETMTNEIDSLIQTQL